MELNKEIREFMSRTGKVERKEVIIVDSTPDLPLNFFDQGKELTGKLLQLMGMNLSDPDLERTPSRMFSALYEMTNPNPFEFTTFDAQGTDEMVFQTGISFSSLCEHHCLPFFGTATVAYIPNNKLAGLSKIARTVVHMSKRFTTQEKLTSAIEKTLTDVLQPRGVAVVLECRHLCIELRGVESPGTITRTSKLTGVFNPRNETGGPARSEFFSLLNRTQ